VEISDFVVAEGSNEHCASIFNASRDETQEIERRLVSPVHIFEGEHCGFFRGRYCTEHVATNLVLAAGEIDSIIESVDNVEQWTERTWRREWIAGSDQHRCATADELGESSYEPGFSNPCLTAKEYEPAVTFIGVGQIATQLE
jgi:hypothetical protein